jgi:hypothetical protein
VVQILATKTLKKMCRCANVLIARPAKPCTDGAGAR